MKVRSHSAFARSILIAAALTMDVSSCHADAAADIASIDAKLQACLKRDDSNTAMKLCTVNAQTEAEKTLTSIYRSVVSQSKSGDPDAQSKKTLQRVVASELAWIAYRDAECKMEGATMLGGSGEGLVIDNCQFRMVQERSKTLLTFLHDSGG